MRYKRLLVIISFVFLLGVPVVVWGDPSDFESLDFDSPTVDTSSPGIEDSFSPGGEDPDFVTPEPTPEPIPETTPEPIPGTTPEPIPETTPDVTLEAIPETTPEVKEGINYVKGTESGSEVDNKSADSGTVAIDYSDDFHDVITKLDQLHDDSLKIMICIYSSLGAVIGLAVVRIMLR